jgi:O-acetyl-ADP-ribose deacetylase (regulator of RNase III)
MITYTSGDLFQSNAIAIVNAVNTVGVMGKGIALQFKNQFPQNYKKYKAACSSGVLIPGKLLVCRERNAFSEEKIIINFPTKTHWRLPSEYRYVEEGLKELAKVITEENIESIAIPALGCGNGGLEWNKVKKMIEDSLATVPAEVTIFQPER